MGSRLRGAALLCVLVCASLAWPALADTLGLRGPGGDSKPKKSEPVRGGPEDSFEVVNAALESEDLTTAVEDLLVEEGIAVYGNGGSKESPAECSSLVTNALGPTSACLKCVRQPGCRYTFDAAVGTGCDPALSAYKHNLLNHSQFHQTIVDAAKYWVFQRLTKQGLTVDGVKSSNGGDVKAGLKATVWNDDLVKKLKEEMGDETHNGFLLWMCSEKGYLAPGMRMRGELRPDTYYEVEGYLAKGANKAIYKGRIVDAAGEPIEINGRSSCVLKISQTDVNNHDAGTVSDARRESLAQKYLNSPEVKDPRRRFIEEIYDDLIYRGTPVLVSEFVTNGMIGKVHHRKEKILFQGKGLTIMTLEANIDDMPDGWRDRRGLKTMLYQWLQGVDYMSDRGFIHHDLHAQNAMFSTDPATGKAEVKIIDFGATAYTHVRPHEDTFMEDMRLRVDIGGQAANPLGPWDHDSKTLSRRFRRESSAGIFMCKIRSRTPLSEEGTCPNPDNVDLETAVPSALAHTMIKYNILPYMTDEYAQLTTSGMYCREVESCRLGPQGHVHNSYDTVNVMVDFIMMLMCTGRVSEGNARCFTSPSRNALPYKRDLQELSQYTTDKEYFAAWAYKVSQESKTYFKVRHRQDQDPLPTEDEWDQYWRNDAAQKFPMGQPFSMFCPHGLEVKADDPLEITETANKAEARLKKLFEDNTGKTARPRWKRMYDVFGIDYKDTGTPGLTDNVLDGRGIVQVLRLWNYFDAEKRSPWADEVLDDPQFQELLEKALDCDPARRYDAKGLLSLPWFDDVRDAASEGAHEGRVIDESVSADVDLSGIMSDRDSLKLESVLDPRTWDWAPTVDLQNGREEINGPYVLPKHRVEVNLADGRSAVHGLDLHRHADAASFVKSLFKAGREGSLDTLKKYLYVVTPDWRLVIAPEATVGEGGTDRGATYTSAPPYPDAKWMARRRPLSPSDLTPGIVTRAGHAAPNDAIEDDVSNPMTPAGHNEMVRKLADSNRNRHRDTLSCQLARHHMVTGQYPALHTEEPDDVRVTMQSAEWGQCGTRVRMAGTIEFREEGHMAVWVLQSDEVAKIAEDNRREIFTPAADQPRVLRRILAALGVDVKIVDAGGRALSESASRPRSSSQRDTVLPTVRDEDGLDVKLPGEEDVPEDPMLVMVIENNTNHVRKFAVECVAPPKKGALAPFRRVGLRARRQVEGELARGAKTVITLKQCRAMPQPRLVLDEKA